MTDQLTTNEKERAKVQGWELVVVYDTRGFFADAIVPVKGSRITTPHEARQFVWETAKLGDAVCRRALSIVAASEVAGQKKKRTKKK